MGSITSTALAIMSRPKSEWLDWVNAWPEKDREAIKDRIRKIHSGEHQVPKPAPDGLERQNAYTVKLAHKQQPIPISISSGATQEEAERIAFQRFFNYEIEGVYRV